METDNKDIVQEKPQKPWREPHRSGRVMGGVIIIAIGVVIFAKRAGADIPHWLISFETLLIALGLYVGFRHSFKGFGWLIPIIIGSFLLMDDIYPYSDLSHYMWPTIIIAVGLFMIFRPKRNPDDFRKQWWDKTNRTTGDDYMEVVVVFGGVKKNIISKDFKGGEAVTVFGGTEINLSQADLNGRVVLEMTQVFGGAKLIVPPHWKVVSDEIVTILGSIEDKRAIYSDPSAVVDESKVLVLKGTCVFGGIDIKSF